MKFEGWLLDLYPSERGMVIWLKLIDGRAVKLIDEYHPTLFVHGSKEDLRKLETELSTSESVRRMGYVEKKVKLRDFKKSRVLKIEVTSIKRFPYFARKVARLGGYRRYHLFNVDVPHTQAYLYERDLFPLARVTVGEERGTLRYELRDSAWKKIYDIPLLKQMWIDLEVQRKGILSTFEDPVARFEISCGEKTYSIEEGDEAEKLLALARVIREEDPDLIFTHGGDSWGIPYLVRRARVNGVLDELVLGRELEPIRVSRRKGRSYFSYGKIYYKSPANYLLGRVHVDVDNSFIYSECGLEGLIELSRVARVPLQRMARVTIGTAMSSIQLYTALKEGVLIPWKKREPEDFKTAWKLLQADRGGFVFEPLVGVHEDVGEIDFGSFYPAMMEKYNISPETILCPCCPDSKQRVPEIGYNICERRRGLIPKVLELVLEKRRTYKRMQAEEKDIKLREIYEKRQAALKWILVTCFGYLGYRNAKFGRIEAHESVTAFARHNLLRAVRIAERNGFQLVHGIVDSLWVKKEGATHREFKLLCKQIEEELGLPTAFEGKYNWIVFLTSKIHRRIPVLNRFYGVFEDGTLKARGIEMRRRDTPQLIKLAQEEMLKSLAEARDAGEFKRRIPKALSILVRYANSIRSQKAEARDLVVFKQLSRHPLAYEVDAHTAIAARQMLEKGIELLPGQTMGYLITNARARNPNLRVKPLQLIEERTKYDRDKYLDMLLDSADSLFAPFGYTKERIRSEVLLKEKQVRF